MNIVAIQPTSSSQESRRSSQASQDHLMPPPAPKLRPQPSPVDYQSFLLPVSTEEVICNMQLSNSHLHVSDLNTRLPGGSHHSFNAYSTLSHDYLDASFKSMGYSAHQQALEMQNLMSMQLLELSQ